MILDIQLRNEIKHRDAAFALHVRNDEGGAKWSSLFMA
jgi:hypothetical protein